MPLLKHELFPLLSSSFPAPISSARMEVVVRVEEAVIRLVAPCRYRAERAARLLQELAPHRLRDVVRHDVGEEPVSCVRAGGEEGSERGAGEDVREGG